jgi:hypothetical protein
MSSALVKISQVGYSLHNETCVTSASCRVEDDVTFSLLKSVCVENQLNKIVKTLMH